MPAVIRLEQIRVCKQGRAILSDIAVSFEGGGAYSILGPSGTGKTTLLRLLNRLEEPTSGSLWYHETPYVDLSPIALRRRVAMVFQVPIVFSGTVRDNLLTPLRLHKRTPANPTAFADALELSGLDATFLDRDASVLSVGEKQRVCIARALMNQPEVLLLDEPTAALDPTAARRLIESIASLNVRLGLTVVMVTHQPESARIFGGQAILLFGGRVLEQTAAAAFFAMPTSVAGRRYLNLCEPGS